MSASSAQNYIGQVRTVCGTVATAFFASNSPGSPTFLDLDKAYPNQPFTIVIFIGNRDSFGGAPEVLFLHARVCIEGLIESYPGRPQIVSNGNDIKIYN